MWVKIIIILVLLVIFATLIRGLVCLVRDAGKTRRTVHALTLRVVLSVSLFLFLCLALKLGWISPHGL